MADDITKRTADNQPIVVSPGTEGSRAILARVAAAVEAAKTVGDKSKEVIEATWTTSMDQMMALELVSEPKLPTREVKDPNESSYDGGRTSFASQSRETHLKILSPEVAAVLSSRYPDLTFTRVRCYVRTGRASLSVATYDLMVPTYKGAMVVNPAASWKGGEQQWIGFRPSTGPTDVKVVSAADLPIMSANEIEGRANYKVGMFSGNEGFHWAKPGVDPEWQVEYKPDLAICRLYIQQTKNLLNEVISALEGASSGLDDVLKVARGEHLLQLDSDGSAPAAAPPAAERGGAATPKAQPRGSSGPDDVDVVS